MKTPRTLSKRCWRTGRNHSVRLVRVPREFNRRVIDLAERNINTGFDLATDLAGARNLGEVMELQATYWRKLLGELQAHQRGRALSSNARGSSRNR